MGRALGVNGVFGSVGSALAPVFVGAMIDWVTWRAAFIIPGVVAVFLGLWLTYAWGRGQVRDSHADRSPQAPPEPGATATSRRSTERGALSSTAGSGRSST